jgi:hypothetical protein
LGEYAPPYLIFSLELSFVWLMSTAGQILETRSGSESAAPSSRGSSGSGGGGGSGGSGSSERPRSNAITDVLRYNGGSSVDTSPNANIVLAAAQWAALHGGKK